jgi:hypothetical protein
MLQKNLMSSLSSYMKMVAETTTETLLSLNYAPHRSRTLAGHFCGSRQLLAVRRTTKHEGAMYVSGGETWAAGRLICCGHLGLGVECCGPQSSVLVSSWTY